MMLDAAKNKLRAPIVPLTARTLALTSLGLGFLRPAPGTWGSLPPPAIAFALVLVFDAGATAITVVLAGLFIVACLACIALGEYAEERFLRKDAAEVVIDETAGQCLPLMYLPFGSLGSGADAPATLNRSLTVAALCGGAFALFRLFDILKPWPARRLESLPRGWGILADDLIAGLYAAIVMQAVLRVLF
jgi:phosphatidylglycerophosphatase A